MVCITIKESIAKVLLWAIIRLRGVQGLLGGLGHSPHVCVIEPWEPPDVGPWDGVCSLRVCPHYKDCLEIRRVYWGDS